MLGLTGEKNIQGEEVQKLDDYADQVFCSVLTRSGEFVSMVSEEQDNIIFTDSSDSNSKYIIAFDPLDGSSNIDVNVSIGTIWGVYKSLSSSGSGSKEEDFFQPGSELVASGYTIYGSSTMFVFSSGSGVHGFTLDPTIGEFILTHPDMKIPQDGSTYSCNQANASLWEPEVVNLIDHFSSGKSEKKYSQRYVGSFVADFHRTMLKGGLFLYPSDLKNKSGKLRLLYECAPMAFLVEQAGGRATNGKFDILKIVPESIHQRTPLFIGSKNLVDLVDDFFQE